MMMYTETRQLTHEQLQEKIHKTWNKTGLLKAFSPEEAFFVAQKMEDIASYMIFKNNSELLKEAQEGVILPACSYFIETLMKQEKTAQEACDSFDHKEFIQRVVTKWWDIKEEDEDN